jgi:hypothetical protein
VREDLKSLCVHPDMKPDSRVTDFLNEGLRGTSIGKGRERWLEVQSTAFRLGSFSYSCAWYNAHTNCFLPATKQKEASEVMVCLARSVWLQCGHVSHMYFP